MSFFLLHFNINTSSRIKQVFFIKKKSKIKLIPLIEQIKMEECENRLFNLEDEVKSKGEITEVCVQDQWSQAPHNQCEYLK
jgi:hypothetical protein